MKIKHRKNWGEEPTQTISRKNDYEKLFTYTYFDPIQKPQNFILAPSDLETKYI